MRTVVAAVIERSDRRLLIGQRRKNDTSPLKWEFPGGKVQDGESPEVALARELQEELGVSATSGDSPSWTFPPGNSHLSGEVSFFRRWPMSNRRSLRSITAATTVLMPVLAFDLRDGRVCRVRVRPRPARAPACSAIHR